MAEIRATERRAGDERRSRGDGPRDEKLCIDNLHSAEDCTNSIACMMLAFVRKSKPKKLKTRTIDAPFQQYASSRISEKVF